ncbi:MAG: 2-hydroxy-6-oxonona-2,4-dienedioate hydrolase [Candidatus Azotimanducaceae bacterium]|jgi:2-hydroxy-6-oxonona-2,4-dienedioate hydrolase
MGILENTIEDRIGALESAALVTTADCGEGTMPFRTWLPLNFKRGYQKGDQMGAELVVLLHGGSGSWNHWIRNIPVLSDYYELVVPDLPGLGDAATLPKGTPPEVVAEIVANGLKSILGSRRFHLVCFSWGSVVGSLAAAQLGAQVKSIMLVGPASLGRMAQAPNKIKLRSRSRSMTVAEIENTNRENLAQLMIYDRARIDGMAVALQDMNITRSRYNSPQYANGEFVLDGLKQTSANLMVIYGSEDAVAANSLEEREQRLQQARPDVHFETVSGVGHWLQYEHADWFNKRTVEWVESNTFA